MYIYIIAVILFLILVTIIISTYFLLAGIERICRFFVKFVTKKEDE